jgi:hypothetical protein
LPDSSHEVHRGAPPSFKQCASTPEARKLPRPGRCQPPDMFRPCRFSRLRRVTPHNALQVYCALQPTIGFAWFHRAMEPEGSALGFPRTPVHPSKRFPPCQPTSSHTPPNKSDGASPTDRPLTPLLRCPLACCHTFRRPSLDLRVLIRQRVRCSTITVASDGEPDAPWAYGLTHLPEPHSRATRGRLGPEKNATRRPHPTNARPSKLPCAPRYHRSDSESVLYGIDLMYLGPPESLRREARSADTAPSRPPCSGFLFASPPTAASRCRLGHIHASCSRQRSLPKNQSSR